MVCYVFTEGKVTEPEYLDLVKARGERLTVKVDNPDYRKRVRFDDLRGSFPQARERAVRLAKRHERDGRLLPGQRDPSTNVYELVDRLGISY